MPDAKEPGSVNTVGPANSWRLVYNEGKVLHLFESVGHTSTIYDLESFPTKEAAEARIAELKLQPLPVEESTDG
jgi:hypothetical protein